MTDQSNALPETGKIQEAPEIVGATALGMNVDTWSRLILVVAITIIVIGLNFSVMKFIWAVFNEDLVQLKAAPQAQRVVTTQVLMSLIGATVVQVGLALIAIVSYLFPKKTQDKAQ